MARTKAINPPKKIRYMLELSEEQHYILKLKAVENRKTIKDLIIGNTFFFPKISIILEMDNCVWCCNASKIKNSSLDNSSSFLKPATDCISVSLSNKKALGNAALNTSPKEHI